MSRRCLALAMAALMTWCGLPVCAQVPADEAQQRAEIRAQREAADRLYRAQQQACTTKFFVSSCVEAARKQHHDTLKQIDLRQAALDDAQREARAAQRREAITSKQSGEEARQREEDARRRSAEVQRGGVVKRDAAPPPHPASSPARAGKEQPTPQERTAEEARARQAFALKQLQAEARRQEAARRNAEHARKTKQAAPLPVPGDEILVPTMKSSGAAPERPASAASAP